MKKQYMRKLRLYGQALIRMKSVFVLQHSYEIDEQDRTKFIGVYSTVKKAENAIKRLKKQTGFCDRPNDFNIDEYELNKDHWREGFSTMTSVMVKNIDDEWVLVGAACLINGNYEIVEKHENHLLEEFKDGDIVKCEYRSGELYAIEKIE